MFSHSVPYHDPSGDTLRRLDAISSLGSPRVKIAGILGSLKGLKFYVIDTSYISYKFGKWIHMADEPPPY